MSLCLVIQGDADTRDNEQARQAGADAFAGKPCDPGSTLAELNALLGNRGRQPV